MKWSSPIDTKFGIKEDAGNRKDVLVYDMKTGPMNDKESRYNTVAVEENGEWKDYKVSIWREALIEHVFRDEVSADVSQIKNPKSP